jgi:hypothetical protein
MHQRLDKVRGQLQSKIRQADEAYILTTLAVEEDLIPERWGNQSSLRNNVMIDLQNKAAEAWIVDNFSSVQTIDLFAYTRAIPSTLRQDAVHFKSQIYSLLAQIAWTAEGEARYLGQSKRLT